MHIEIKGTDFLKEAQAIGATADQLPFVMSLALNRAIKTTRDYLIKTTWPQSIKARNPTFIRAALNIEWSDKYNLSVSIFDALKRASLKAHAEGGVKQPKGQNIAIPNIRNVRLGPHGVPTSQRPANLRVAFINDNRQILEVVGRGKARYLRPMYILRPKVNIKKDVPFHEDFADQMTENINQELPGAVIDAMRTAR
jgi:hypothetical protein